MLFMVRFADKPNMLPLRQELLPSHLQWLEQHAEQELVAGSLRSQPDEVPVGACWIVEAQTKDEIESLLQTDPFFAQGLRSAHEVLHWSKAFPERKVAV